MLWGLLAAGLVTHLVPDGVQAWAQQHAGRVPAPLQAAALLGAVLLVRYAGATKVVPFIYFQF